MKGLFNVEVFTWSNDLRSMNVNPCLLWSHSVRQLPHLAQYWPHPFLNPPLGPIPLISPHICHTQFVQTGKDDIGTLELFLIEYTRNLRLKFQSCFSKERLIQSTVKNIIK